MKTPVTRLLTSVRSKAHVSADQHQHHQHGARIAMERRLSRLPGNHGDAYGTFVFADEGHTLGNALASVISEYPNVKICGHTVPHPAEKRVHLNIQTTGENVIEVLKRGLHDLEKMCDHTLETFDKSYEKYKSSQDVPDTT
ncbi:DNA-directed RNA polymerases I and III subunit RPAC2 [Temnothorax nylanderi]|uniref:DNA-directed RNA polymerases I and III subunit RPAC2 n=1 Tax=Temnothorax nylanderi TaxID=102681 RepID=UPI003A83DFB4